MECASVSGGSCRRVAIKVKILAVLGEHNYGDPSRGQGYEFTNFLPALRRLGHNVVFFESFNKGHYVSFADLNRSLLRLVEQEQPDVVFFVLMGYEVWSETLDVLRTAGVFLVNWGTDDSWKYDSFARFVAPKLDIYVTTCPRALEKARRDGLTNVVLSQWAANGEVLHEPLSAKHCRHAVTFVGSAYGDRPRWIQGLRERGIEVECFGHGWPAGPVPAADIATIVRTSIISLNFADAGPHGLGIGPKRRRQIKARTFEVPGAGGFLLTEQVDRLEDYYQPGVEIAVFEGVEDLARQIKYFLARPELRDRIAMAGHRRTQTRHTYEARFQEILGPGTTLSSATEKGRSFRFDSNAFEALVRSHSIGPLSRILRTCLIGPCRVIWGKERGPRAARRLLFEASWRLSGEQTYSARGLPGRLFYAES